MSWNDGLTPVIPLHIEQGTTFGHTFQWLNGGVFMAPIELIEEGYPTIVTVTDHGLNTETTDHPIILSGAEGLKHFNAKDTEIAVCTRLDANRFSVPRSTVGEEWIEGTGEITYLIPTDLTNYTAVMRIRKNWHTETVIHELTTENGGIQLGTVDGVIGLTIDKATTSLFTFKNAVYDVDLVDASGRETRVFKGPVTLHRDI